MTERNASARLAEIAAEPVRLVAFGPAGDLLGDLVGPRSFLHAGPPIAPAETMGAMRGALIGALLFEGEARSAEDAVEIIERGELNLRPCHDAGGVGPLAGVVSPRVPVAVVARPDGLQAFAPVVEGLGTALSFGNFDEATLAKLQWLAGDFSDVMNRAFAASPELDLIDLQARALRRGDEGHNRLVAATEKLIGTLAPAFMEIGTAAAPVLGELRQNPHFYLTLSLAAAKSISMAIEQAGPVGVVTALSGNGVQAAIRVSGLPDHWAATGPILPSQMMVVPGKSEADAAPLMGDSGVTETVGLGAFSLTASLSLARVLGVDAASAQQIVDDMRKITVAEHPKFLLPADDFRGSPLGISAAAVRDTGISPAVNAGYASKVPGEGRVGADVARFPVQPFADAADVVETA